MGCVQALDSVQTLGCVVPWTVYCFWIVYFSGLYTIPGMFHQPSTLSLPSGLQKAGDVVSDKITHTEDVTGCLTTAHR